MKIGAAQRTSPAQSPKAATIDRSLDTQVTFTRNVSWSIVSRGVYFISRIMIPPFVVARIGLQKYGLWSAVFLLVSYITFSALGASSAYVKYVAEYIARGQFRKANSLLSTGILTVSIVGLVVFGATVIAAPWIVKWFNVAPQNSLEAYRLLLFIVAVFGIGLSLNAFSDTLAGSQRIAETEIVSIAGYSIETALIFILVGAGYGIMGLAAAFAVRVMIGIVLSIYLAFKFQPWLKLSIRFCSKEALWTLVNFGGIVQLNFLLCLGLNTIERLIAAPLIGLGAVGLLDLSDKLPNSANTVASAFAVCFMPAASHLQGSAALEHGYRDAVLALYLRGARYMSLTAAGMLGLLASASVPIMMIWIGKIYPGAALLLALFAVQQQFHTMTGPGTSILKGLGRPIEEIYYIVPNIILLAFTIPASRVILGHWSPLGLGSAVVVATLGSSLVFLIRAHFLLGVRWKQYIKLVLWPAAVPYIVGVLCAWPLWLIVPRVGRLSGAGVLLGIGFLYLLILLIALDRFVFSGAEREWIRSIVRGRTGSLINWSVVEEEA
jgi:O-antigen/teichoic acid export membrane protein